MGRWLFAVIAGLLAGVAVIAVAQALGHAVYPPPPGMDPTDVESVEAHAASLPAGAFVLVLVAHALGALAGGAVAMLVAGRVSLRPSLVVGVLLLLAGVANLLMIPHPTWFAVVDVLLYLPLSWAAARPLRRPLSVAPT